MTTVFEPMSPSARASFSGAYLDYLRKRDGAPDREQHRFDVRERFFEQVDREPVRWHGTPPVDQVVFDRNHKASRPEPGLNEATLWALATAKANRAERYGVEYAFEHGRLREAPRGDDPLVYVEIEEFYHTRILRDALRSVGVEMEMLRPGLPTRVMVRLMVRLPRAMSNVVVLCGEIVGVAIFRLLLDKARELFASQPAVLARITSLFEQILVDEVGHVHFVRSQLGPTQIRAARAMLPLVAKGTFEDMPDLVALFGEERVMRTVLDADIDGAVSDQPDRFVVPA